MSSQINTMKDIIGYAAKTYGENPAIRYKVRKEVVTKTYLDLKRDSEAFSRALEGMGMLGKHVAVIGPTTYEWIISYFGAADSGCVIVLQTMQLILRFIQRNPVIRNKDILILHRCISLRNVRICTCFVEKDKVFGKNAGDTVQPLLFLGQPDCQQFCQLLFILEQ